MDVLVHGGAGGAPTEPRQRQAVVDQAAEAGTTAATPLAAVIAAVEVMEDSPRFNAGVGGTFQTDGVVRTDAGLMTDDRAVGAVTGLPGVQNPSALAKIVLEETPHVLLGPAGALELAKLRDIPTDCELMSERLQERFEEAKVPAGFAGEFDFVREQFGDKENGDGCLDTVGAVATDGEQLAAATSTGGRWLALRGRIGDVPQIGSGFYCTPEAAVSTTGAGEDIARVTLAREVARRIGDGQSPQDAVIDAIADFEAVTDSRAGVIAITPDGEIGTAFNTTRMQTAAASRER